MCDKDAVEIYYPEYGNAQFVAPRSPLNLWGSHPQNIMVLEDNIENVTFVDT